MKRKENTMKIVETRELAVMPFDIDQVFYIGDGRQGRRELCQATGMEVRFEGDDTWWNEFQDSDGDFWYGR